MEAKAMFKMVRKACGDINNVKQEEHFDMNLSDTELAKKFIEYCQTTEDENVPESASEAWSKIPAEWEDNGNNIPVVEKKERRKAESKGRPAKLASSSLSRGMDGKCTLFGQLNTSAKRCQVCEAEYNEEFTLCQKYVADVKAKKAADRAAKREEAKAKKAAEKAAEKAKKDAMTDEEKAAYRLQLRKETYQKRDLSRYGHRLGTTAALIDDCLFKGIDHESLVRTILENNPDTNEDKARVKVRDHINYLPKKRGIVVTITKRDNAPDFYKTSDKTWCKDPLVEPTANVVEDKRTPRPTVTAE